MRGSATASLPDQTASTAASPASACTIARPVMEGYWTSQEAASLTLSERTCLSEIQLAPPTVHVHHTIQTARKAPSTVILGAQCHLSC